MDRSDKYSLLLLAGGKSSRMGQDKAELIYHGQTFMEVILQKAKELGIVQIYVSGYKKEIEGVHIVKDEYPDRGPLGGLHACMKAMNTPYCLVLPVDVPGLSVEILDELLRFHEEKREGLRTGREVPLLWEHGDRKEPLISVYPTYVVPLIEDVIREHSAPVFRALDRTGYECVRIEMLEEQNININTPEIYEKLIKGEKR